MSPKVTCGATSNSMPRSLAKLAMKPVPMGRAAWVWQADSGFVDMLAEVRAGAFTPAAAAALQRRCSRPLDTTDGILPTKACSGIQC